MEWYLAAATGFQKKGGGGYTKDELTTLFKNTLKTPSKFGVHSMKLKKCQKYIH